MGNLFYMALKFTISRIVLIEFDIVIKLFYFCSMLNYVMRTIKQLFLETVQFFVLLSTMSLQLWSMLYHLHKNINYQLYLVWFNSETYINIMYNKGHSTVPWDMPVCILFFKWDLNNDNGLPTIPIYFYVFN